MRIPIAIVMLCLPVAAMGEIFSCTSTYGVLIKEDGLIGQGLNSTSWIVDTERGVRVPAGDGVTQDYFGECEVLRVQNAANVWCTAEDDNLTKAHIELNKLPTGEINFMASRFMAFNSAFAGKCVEI